MHDSIPLNTNKEKTPTTLVAGGDFSKDEEQKQEQKHGQGKVIPVNFNAKTFPMSLYHGRHIYPQPLANIPKEKFAEAKADAASAASQMLIDTREKAREERLKQRHG